MRFCILLCYLCHDLDDWECRACLCFCLFLLRNSLCNQLLALIDCNGRKTVLDTERTNGKGQVSEQIFVFEEQELKSQDKMTIPSGVWHQPGG